jgi:hypothetical protein
MTSVDLRHRPNMRAVACLCFGFLTLFPSIVFATKPSLKRSQESQGEDVLRLYLNRGRSVNMRGTETIIVQPPRGSMLSLTRRVTRTSSGVTHTRWLDPPSEKDITIFDDGVWSKCYFPREKLTKVSRSTTHPRDPKSTGRLTRLILHNYRVTYEGRAPMAGRPCYKIRLTPSHPMSNVVRMWIDVETGALLSLMQETARGETLSVGSFNGVEFPRSVDAGELKKSLPAKAKEVNFSRSEIVRTFAELKKRAGFDFCAPYAMPGGYEFQHAELLSIKGEPTTCIRYSDGLSEITVCQNRAQDQRPAEYRFTQPMVDPMGNNMVDYRIGQMNYILVGRCSLSGLMAVTNALDAQREKVFLDYLARNYRTPIETLAGLRNQGIGMDTLDALLAIRQQMDVPLSTLVALFKDGYGWTAIARRFRANVGRIVQHVRTFECR